MARDIAIVLNNGSVNAAVATALAAQKYRLVTLYVDAAGSLASRSKQAYDMQVGHFKPFREHTITLPFINELTDRKSTNLPTDPRMSVEVAPELKQLLPMIAATAMYANNYQAAAIYLGLRVGPANDPLARATEYLQIWSELLQHPCGLNDLEIVAPLLELEPWQVIDVGSQVAAPLERTWSCQDDSAEACWACAKCRARESAFQQAGKADPLRAVARR